MPLKVDKWRGSPAVRAMHPAARSGYLDLLLSQWQSEDCSISSDSLDLAELSFLGDELWALYGVRILRNFVTLENGRLRNLVCFEEWEEAQHVFYGSHKPLSPEELHVKRSEAGKYGNKVRWGNRKPSQVAIEQSQNDPKASLTGTETVTETKEQSKGAKPVVVRFSPPPWIDPSTWQDFEAHRGKLRKPMTDRARRDIIAKLEALQARGQDPEAMLAQSIRKGWQDVFEVKEDFSATPKPPAPRPKTQYELNTEAQLEERRQAIAAAGVVQ